MSITKRQARMAQLRNMKSYLGELRKLLRRDVCVEELLSLDQTASLQSSFGEIDSKVRNSIEIPFEHRSGSRFDAYINRLAEANASEVYVSIRYSHECGMFLADSLKIIDIRGFSFDYPNEHLIFITSDFRDRLLLDYSIDDVGLGVLMIDTEGANWPCVAY